MLINRARVDFLDVYSTPATLTGAQRQAGAGFNFLFKKAPYNWKQGEAEKAPVTPGGVYPVPLRIRSVCGGPAGSKNFWRGNSSSPRVYLYTGYLGAQEASEVAWDLLLPFSLDLPVSITSTESGIEAAAFVFLWPCGWAVRLQLEVEVGAELQPFAARMRHLRTVPLSATIGTEQTTGPADAVLAWIADWVRRHVVQSVFSVALPGPVRFGPFTVVTVRHAPGMAAGDAALDETAQRLFYAAATQDGLWESVALDKVKAAFKHPEGYPGSFIVMGRMARLVWFPRLMGRRTHRALDCYVENTLAATMMMAALAEFVRLVTAQQDGAALKVHPALRNLYRSATTRLGEFQAVYQNTNLKRFAADLQIAKRIADASARLP